MELINGILALLLAIILVIAIFKIQRYNDYMASLEARLDHVENLIKENKHGRRKESRCRKKLKRSQTHG